MKYLEGSRGSVRFQYDRSKIVEEELVRAVEKVNPAYRVTIGSPKDVPPAKQDIDFRILSAGGRYDLSSSLVKGKVTIVHFDDTDDMRSVSFGLELERTALKHDCAIRKVYLGDETAQTQFKQEFGAKTLPYLRIYDREGTFLGEALTVDEANKLLSGP